MSSSPPVTKTERTAASWIRVFVWYISPRLWLRKIIGLDDTPHAIALGAAIGVFVAMTPTVGIQMLIVLAISALFKPLFRFNKLAGLISVYISNPVTTLPIYWFNYWVGSFFIPGNLTRDRLAVALQFQGFGQWCKSMWSLLVEIGWPLLLGSLIVGVICALPAYPVIKWLVEAIQVRKRAKKLKKHPTSS